MRKKLLLNLFAAFIMIFALASCGSKNEDGAAQNKFIKVTPGTVTEDGDRVIVNVSFENVSGKDLVRNGDECPDGAKWEKKISYTKEQWKKNFNDDMYIHYSFKDKKGKTVFEGGAKFTVDEEYTVKDIEVFEE